MNIAQRLANGCYYQHDGAAKMVEELLSMVKIGDLADEQIERLVAVLAECTEDYPSK